VDEQLLFHNAMALLDAEKPALAASLLSKLRSATDTQIAESAQRLLEQLVLRGVKIGKASVALVVQMAF
jgi:hypothetical protein